MSKKYYPLIMYIMAALCAAGFCIRLWADYVYLYPWGSSPFWLYVAERFVEFLLPAAGCLTAGLILKNRLK